MPPPESDRPSPTKWEKPAQSGPDRPSAPSSGSTPDALLTARPAGPLGPPPDLSPVRDSSLTRYQGQRDSETLMKQEALLTDENREALRDYGDTLRGRDYNRVLRNGELDDSAAAAAGRLDEAFISTYEEDNILYRGVHSPSDREAFLRVTQMQPGDVIYDRGYQSATQDIAVAKNYANEGGLHRTDTSIAETSTSQRGLFEIEVPEGTRVAYLDLYNKHGEAEDLLPRDSMLEYLGHHTDDEGYVHVRLRYVQEGLPGDGGNLSQSADGAAAHVPPSRLEWPIASPTSDESGAQRSADSEARETKTTTIAPTTTAATTETRTTESQATELERSIAQTSADAEGPEQTSVRDSDADRVWLREYESRVEVRHLTADVIEKIGEMIDHGPLDNLPPQWDRLKAPINALPPLLNSIASYLRTTPRGDLPPNDFHRRDG